MPVAISLGLLRKAMEASGPHSRFLIDGFPRNSDNVEARKRRNEALTCCHTVEARIEKTKKTAIENRCLFSWLLFYCPFSVLCVCGGAGVVHRFKERYCICKGNRS